MYVAMWVDFVVKVAVSIPSTIVFSSACIFLSRFNRLTCAFVMVSRSQLRILLRFFCVCAFLFFYVSLQV